MTPATHLTAQFLWLLLVMVAAVAAACLRWMQVARRLEASREPEAGRTLRTASLLVLIAVIISACLAALMYFRAVFPH